MRGVNELLNQGAIELGKINLSLKLPPISPLAQLTVATQIGEVHFAHRNQDRRKQGDEKLGLRFAKPPTCASRLCTMTSIGYPFGACVLLAP